MTGPVPTRRVTVIAPTARVDISLPQQSTVAELVPILVRMTAGDSAGTGWRLGRLGADPLASSSTVADAGIRDGELLYLTSRDAKPAPLLFDDVVDAIASTAGDPIGRWRLAATRAVGLAGGSAGFVLVGVLVAAARPAWPLTTAINGMLALVLLLAAAGLARGLGDTGAGAALAAAGVPVSLLAGLALGLPDGASPFAPRAVDLAIGCAVLAVYAGLATAAVADRFAWFVAVAVAAAIGLTAALLTGATDTPPEQVAAIVAALALVVSPLLPVAALRVGRLPLPRVPVDVAAFRRDETPTLGPEVADRTRVASDVVAGLLLSIAIAVTASAVVLAWTDTGWTRALAGMVGFSMLLRARSYVLGWQRAALLAGGIATLAVVAFGIAASGLPEHRPALIAGVAVLGLVGVTYGVRARINQPSPYWTRLLDVFEVLAVVSLVPLAAGVLGLYEMARSLG